MIDYVANSFASSGDKFIEHTLRRENVCVPGAGPFRCAL